MTTAYKEIMSKQIKEDEFYNITQDMNELHAKKGKDYGTDDDPYANIRAASLYGVSPFMASLLLIGNKVKRLQAYAQNGTLENEGVEDTLIDLANYAVIALVLFREENADNDQR